MKPFTLSALSRKLDSLGHNCVADDYQMLAAVVEAVLDAAGLDWEQTETADGLEEYRPQTPDHRAQGWEFIGECGVDSATLAIGDPCYFFGPDCEAQKKGSWSDVLREAYAAGLNPNGGFTSAPLAYGRGHEGLAVLVDVAGDGTYSVEARRNERGQIVEVRFFTGASEHPLPGQFEGPLHILDGHPVPYSATCQRRRREDGQLESVNAADFLADIDDWLKLHRPGQKLLRCDGAYFFYSAEPTPGPATGKGGAQ